MKTRSILVALLLSVACSNQTDEPSTRSMPKLTPMAAEVEEARLTGGASSEAPPSTLPGTTARDQTFVRPDGSTFTFSCYGGCGASCSLVRGSTKQETHLIKHPSNPDLCTNATYEIISGATHEFCSWHDSCYLNAEFQNRNPSAYTAATRYCDLACTDPDRVTSAMNRGRDRRRPIRTILRPGRTVPAVLADTELGLNAALAVGYPPPSNHGQLDCVRWASTAVGQNNVADRAAGTGTAVWSQLLRYDPWFDCEPKKEEPKSDEACVCTLSSAGICEVSKGGKVLSRSGEPFSASQCVQGCEAEASCGGTVKVTFDVPSPSLPSTPTPAPTQEP